jgi:hypothetical protein
MFCPRQSSTLWPVLAGVLAGLSVAGCAGRVGEEGPAPSGSGGAPSSTGAGSGNGGSGAGATTGNAGTGNSTGSGFGGSGNGAGTGVAGSGVTTGSAGTGVSTGAAGTGSTGTGNTAGTGVVISGAGGSNMGPVTLLPAGIRRLSNAEYDASVQALLGTTQSPSRSFPPDARQAIGFTMNDEQRVDPVLARALDDAALALVSEARGNGKLASLAPCSNATTMGAACAATFINSFGAKVYRRPPAAAEVTALQSLYAAGATGGSYNDGIDLVTRGMLQSAAFLYVTQLGDSAATTTTTLTQHEMASTLAFLVTAAPPDQTLLDMASGGGLSTPDAREVQARRLLALPAGKTRLLRVVREWLGLDELAANAKDAKVYPRFTDAIRTSIDSESVNFINEVMQNSTGTVSELLSANWSIVDTGLAGIYGVTSAGAGRRTTLPRRVGILNQAGFLGRYAKAQESSPVLRGVAVMRRVACMSIPDPTALNIVVVPPVPDLTRSTRERFTIHATDAVCSACHITIDALGFAFELFDGMGAQRPAGTQAGTLRDDNGVNTTSATTVTSTGSFPNDFAGSYADSNALAMALANSGQVRECMARQMFRASSGRSGDAFRAAEQSFVDFWRQLPANSQGTFKEAIVAYVRSPLFDRRNVR